MSDLNNTIEQTKAQAQDVAHDASRHAKSVVDDVTAQARSVARDATDTIKSEVAARADSAKGAAAAEVSNVASALRKAAQESRLGSAQERTFGQIADSLADASEAISNKDLGTALRDVGDFARRHPLTFLAGAALAGLAVSRFAKASERHATVVDDDPFMPPRHGNADFTGRV